MSTIREKGIWLWNKFFDWSALISALAVVGLTVVDISDLNDLTIKAFGVEQLEIGNFIYYALVVLALAFSFFSVSHSKEVSKLESELQTKAKKIVDLESSWSQIVGETNELFNSYLKLFLKSLDFKHTERISVYKTYDERFILMGRTSTNPTNLKLGRRNYPLNEGFIGKGWAEGECFVDDLPDPNTRNGDSYYNAICKINHIEKDTLNKIKMKSRTYFVYRINGFDDEPKAVVVVESLKEKAFTKEFVLEKLEMIKQPLIMFVEKMNSGIIKSELTAENIGL